MRLPTILLAIALVSLVFMVVLYYVDLYLISPLRESSAEIDSLGPGVNETTIPTPSSGEDIIVTWNTTTKEIIITNVSGNGRVFVHVPPNMVVAMSNSTWSDYLVNDGSDGQDVVSPYREYELSPGKYRWSIVTRPRVVKDVYSVVLGYVGWIMLIFGAVILAILLYSEKR